MLTPHKLGFKASIPSRQMLLVRTKHVCFIQKLFNPVPVSVKKVPTIIIFKGTYFPMNQEWYLQTDNDKIVEPNAMSRLTSVCSFATQPHELSEASS